MKSEAEVGTIELADYPELARFCAREKNDGRDEDFWSRRFRHWWDQNPSMEPSFPRGAIMRTSKGVRGVYCCFPMRTVLEGDEILSAVRSTWIVAGEQRSHSLLLSNLVDELTANTLSLNTTSIDQLLPLLELSGWVKFREEFPSSIIPGDWTALGRKVLRLHRRILEFPPFLSSDPALSQERAEEIACDVWSQSSTSCRFGPIRDGSYFSWYSLKNPSEAMSWTAYFPSRDEPASSVFALTVHHGDGCLRVMDIWPQNREAEVYIRFFRWLKKETVSRGFHAIRVPQFSESMRQALKRIAFPFRQAEPQRFYLLNQTGLSIPPHSDSWPLNSGDIGV